MAGATGNETYEYMGMGQVGRDGFCRTLPGPAAFARRYYGYFDHFAPGQIGSSTTYAGFTVTVLTAGTIVMADSVGGWLNLLSGGAATQGIQMQSDGEMYLPAADKDIFFEASIRITDADDIDWMLGLASTDTDIFTTDPTEIIAFRGDDGDANIDFQVRNGGTGAQADTASDAGDGTAVRLGFRVRGATDVVGYINGVAQTPVTTNIPTAEMALTFGMRGGATTAANVLGLDWVRILQIA